MNGFSAGCREVGKCGVSLPFTGKWESVGFLCLLQGNVKVWGFSACCREVGKFGGFSACCRGVGKCRVCREVGKCGVLSGSLG